MTMHENGNLSTWYQFARVVYVVAMEPRVSSARTIWSHMIVRVQAKL